MCTCVHLWDALNWKVEHGTVVTLVIRMLRNGFLKAEEGSFEVNSYEHLETVFSPALHLSAHFEYMIYDFRME